MMRTLSLIVFLLVSASGCFAQNDLPGVIEDVRSSYPDVEHISTDSLAALLESNDTIYILDTRARKEFEVSHIPGAIWIDPSARAFPELEAVDKSATVVAYCSVGYRSSKIARRLRVAGHTNVANLQGSIFQWANEGRQLVDEAGEVVASVHPYNERWGRMLREELRH